MGWVISLVNGHVCALCRKRHTYCWTWCPDLGWRDHCMKSHSSTCSPDALCHPLWFWVAVSGNQEWKRAKFFLFCCILGTSSSPPSWSHTTSNTHTCTPVHLRCLSYMYVFLAPEPSVLVNMTREVWAGIKGLLNKVQHFLRLLLLLLPSLYCCLR